MASAAPRVASATARRPSADRAGAFTATARLACGALGRSARRRRPHHARQRLLRARRDLARGGQARLGRSASASPPPQSRTCTTIVASVSSRRASIGSAQPIRSTSRAVARRRARAGAWCSSPVCSRCWRRRAAVARRHPRVQPLAGCGRGPAGRLGLADRRHGSSSRAPPAAPRSCWSHVRVLLGRLQPGRYPRRGWLTCRLWFVERLAEVCHLDRLAGTPWAARYARIGGAEVGEGARLGTLPPVTGLLSVGAGATLEGDVDAARLVDRRPGARARRAPRSARARASGRGRR